MLHSI